MRRDGDFVTVAAPPNVINLERGYLSSPASTTALETVARSTGHRNALLMIRTMIPGSKEREMTLDEVEAMSDHYRRGETVAILRHLIERLTVESRARIRPVFRVPLVRVMGSWVGRRERIRAQRSQGDRVGARVQLGVDNRPHRR